MKHHHSKETIEKIRKIRLSRETYKRPCIHCGKIFGGGSGLSRSVKYCSRKCYLDSGFHSKFMKSHPNSGQKNVGIKKRKIVICKICKNNFETIPCSKQKYCSRNCYSKDSSNILSGKPKSIEHIKKVNEAVKKYWDKKGRKKNKRSYHNTNKKYIKWRITIFIRDNYRCQICKSKEKILQAHHIRLWAKYPKLRYKISNGITVCVPCHKWCHQHRKVSSLTGS